MAVDRKKTELQWLNAVRSEEFDTVRKLLPSARDAKVLEIGSGTGFLLDFLGQLYDSVDGIEIESSAYNITDPRISMYDGKNIPFEDNSFNIIFSCHVIEHIENFDSFCKETKRVLKPNGMLIHIAPSSTWRFFTTLFHYFHLMTLPFRIFVLQEKSIRQRSSKNYKSLKDKILYIIMSPRHGLTGNRVTEIYYFSRKYWDKKFKKNGFNDIEIYSSEIVYWGHDIFQFIFPIQYRQFLSKIFGSSSNIFVFKSVKKD